MRTRTMSYLCLSESAVSTLNNVVTHPLYSFVSQGNLITDELHIWPPPKGIGLRDVGGALDQVKYEVKVDSPTVSTGYRYYTGKWDRYVGPLFAHAQALPHAATTFCGYSSAFVDDTILFAKGGTAIARCAPTNPHASLSQALGELRRDGIPAIPGLQTFQKGARPIAKKLKRGKKSVGKTVPAPWQLAGSEYLNVEFGWKPLFSDIRKLATAQRDSHRVLSQYAKDSGRLVRRKYEFPAETTKYTDVNLGLTRAYMPSVCVVSQGTCIQSGQVETTYSFSGAFTYHVSDADSLVGNALRSLQMANHLTGAGITPAAMWDIMPYSWAIDWVMNMGDVIQNASAMALDGLVVVYGYIMATRVTTTTFTVTGLRLRDYNGAGSILIPPFTQTYIQTRRQRRRATPFGFGLNISGFSPRQLAIVAALGLSRDGRKLAL